MEYIDKIYYINLDRRTDRKELFEKQVEKYELPMNKIVRFSAIEDNYGAIGCSKSHLEILKLAQKNKYRNVLIFEDDFEFLVSKEEFYNNLNKFFKNYKDNFDFCYLQYNLLESEEKDNIVGYARKTFGGAGYIINNRILKKFIEILEKAIDNFIKTHNHQLYAIDTCWHPLQKSSESFYFKKRIGKQRASYSDIEKSFVDYNL